jgi:hypothetical protein
MSASLAVQQLVMAALVDMPGITGVYDGPPPDAPPPYLVIGSDIMSDAGTKTEIAHDHRLAINIWDAGPGAAATKVLIGELVSRLSALDGARDGHRIISSRLLRTLVLTDAEGWTQGIVEIRVRSAAL